jgi:hypothetical protein
MAGHSHHNATLDSVLHRRKWKKIYRASWAIEMEVEVVKARQGCIGIQGVNWGCLGTTGSISSRVQQGAVEQGSMGRRLEGGCI